ncbi:MAG: phosphatidylglycerol lysyltransferase domain-containing protein [Polyangiales bacterium]
MIPTFPVFKRLELGDLTEVTVHTRRYDPYSDFNFVSLWSWNTAEDFALSHLHGNLVVRLNDYVTEAPFYTFLGENAQSETAAALIRRSLADGMGPSLRLVPEPVALKLDRAQLAQEMDVDGNDYVLSVARLRRFDGRDMERRRTEINRFRRENPHHTVEQLDLADRAVTSAMETLFERWALHKGTANVFDLHEYHAFQRFLSAAAYLPETFAFGVRVRDRLCAFAILELLPRRFAMAHFWKADIEHTGLYAFMMSQMGEMLAERGRDQLNFQQDLGLSGLRFSKKSYVPAAYLRKYSVVERAASARPGLRLSIPAMSDAFLASVDTSVFPGDISLRPPALSSELIDLARAEDEPARANVRRSGIGVVGEDADDPVVWNTAGSRSRRE